MEIDGTALAAEMVGDAFAARNVKNTTEAQVAVLDKVLAAEQQTAANLLRMMGVGGNLDVLA